MRNSSALPSDSAVRSFKERGIAKIPDGSVEGVGCTNAAQVFSEGGMDGCPMGPSVSGEQNGSGLADDPADLLRRRGTGREIGEHVADLSQPRSSAIARIL